MDTLYVGDIPSEFKYASFSNDYITLYAQPSAHNETLNYFRIYDYDLGFYYSTGTQTFGQTYSYFAPINTSNNWLYRNDIDKIFIVCFIIFFMFLFTFNLVTSSIKKGGIFRWSYFLKKFKRI